MNALQTIAHRIKDSKYTKYVVTICVIVLVVGFLDENSIANRKERIAEIERLEQEISLLKAKYEADTQKLNSLDEYDHVVRLAREKYLMKRPNEDIFVIKTSR
jgi:cell division protein FtsB